MSQMKKGKNMENNGRKDEIIIEELLKNLRESKNWTYNDVAYNLNDTNILSEDIKKHVCLKVIAKI